MPRRSHHSETRYRQRLLGAMAVVLLLATATVQLWPTWPETPPELPFRDRGAETIQIKEVQPTRQSMERSPPPPAPLPPVVVPNDRLIEVEMDEGTSALQLDTPGDDAVQQDGTARQATASRTPDQSARLFRAMSPTYPPAAREDGVRARVVVEVDVDTEGRVTGARILRRWHLSEGGAAQPVARLQYGLEDAALTAAKQSRFRPARAGGVAVATRTTITFTFGD